MIASMSALPPVTEFPCILQCATLLSAYRMFPSCIRPVLLCAGSLMCLCVRKDAEHLLLPVHCMSP